MTIVEPLPDLQWGRGSWQDYISNWRTRDTSWMQERLILRYQTAAARSADYGSPKDGQVTYNDQTKTLEMWRTSQSAWVRSLMFQYLISSQDTAAGVNIYHSGAAAGKGITFTPTNLLVDAPTTNFLTDKVSIDATGLAIKTGTKVAKLSTSDTDLVSDSPLTVPSETVTGALTVQGSLTAPSATLATALTVPSINMSGTLTGGVLNGASGIIGSVTLAGGVVLVASGAAAANSPGFQSGQGYFYGDANSARIAQRATPASAAGAAYVQVQSDSVVLQVGTGQVQFAGQPRVMANRSMQYNTTAGLFSGGPVIVQSADPGVANVPEGTIWAF